MGGGYENEYCTILVRKPEGYIQLGDLDTESRIILI
jgi:hypothetical protein